MKITNPMKDVTLQIESYKFKFSKYDIPQIQFKLNIVDSIYDPIYMAKSLDDKSLKWTLSSIRYMTGIVTDSFLALDPDGDRSTEIIGKKFTADIVINSGFVNIRLPNDSKPVDRDFLKELDKKYQRELIEYSAEHAVTEDPNEIKF